MREHVKDSQKKVDRAFGGKDESLPVIAVRTMFTPTSDRVRDVRFSLESLIFVIHRQPYAA